ESNTAVKPFLRDWHAREKSGSKHIGIAVFLVKDDPHLLHRVTFAFLALQRLTKGHVIAGLVNKTLAILINNERARQRALRQENTGILARQRCLGREPPRLVH